MSLQNRALIPEDTFPRNSNRNPNLQLVKRSPDVIPEQLSFAFVDDFTVAPPYEELSSLVRCHSIGAGWRHLAICLTRLNGSTDW
jgi:hypothetical protein